MLLLGVLWVLVTGLVARSRLDGIRPELRQYRSALAAGDVARAQEVGRSIEARAGSAHQLTSGPAWWVGSHLLGVGSPLRTTRQVSFVLHRLSRTVLPQVPELTTDVFGAAHGSGAAAGASGVAHLQALGERVSRLRALVRQSISAVQATPDSWLGPVSDGRAQALGRLSSIDDSLGSVHRAIDVAVPMLGAQRPQRYFIGFMNEAESRAIGGLPGAFAIVDVDRGHITVEHIGSDNELAKVHADVELGKQYDTLYGQDDPTGIIQNSDIGPSFPDAARIWAGMWQARTGEHVDGALTVDPSTLAYLLHVTGPTELPDGTAVTAHDVTNLTQSRQYMLYPGFTVAQATKRKQFLATIAQAVSRKLLDVASPSELVAPLRRAVAEHRILVWSDVASRERALAAAGVAGVLRPGNAPFSGFVVDNASGGKMDFYLHRSTTYRTSTCRAGRTATASFTLSNETPDYHLPAYVTYVSGGRPAGAAPGFNRTIVAYYATPGARIRSVELDGKPLHLTPVREDSLTSVRTTVDLPADAHRTLRVVVREPATTGPVQILRQPLVHPLHVRTLGPSCAEASGHTAQRTHGAGPGVVVVIVGAVVVLAAGGLVIRRRVVRSGRARGTDAA